MFNRFYNCFEKFKLLKQYGFRSKRSSTDALVYVAEKMQQKSNKTITTSVFLDS